MAAISKIFGVDDGSSAAIAKKVAQSKIAVEADAAQASADVFLQAIEAIPFPADLVAAPALAAATHAEVTALGAFERGGIVPQTMPALVHAGEMVLPKNLSTFVQQSAASASRGGGHESGGNTQHVHNNIKIHVANNGSSPLSPDDITAAVRRAIRTGKLKPEW